MTKLITALTLLLCLGTANAQGVQTSIDPPRCVSATAEQVKSYALVITGLSITVGQAGGEEEVERKLTTVESQLVNIAIREMYQFSSGKVKCWALTRAQTLAFLKTELTLLAYVQEKKLTPNFVKLMVRHFGERVGKLLDNAQEMSQKLSAHAPPL